MIPVAEVAEQLLVIACFWPDYKGAVALDQERRASRAGDVDLLIYEAFRQPPLGVTGPFSNRQSGRKRRRKPTPKKTPLPETWEADSVKTRTNRHASRM